MTTMTRNGMQVTVPDAVAESYASQGWVAAGSPAPAEPGLDSLTIPQLRHFAAENGVNLSGMKRKPQIIAAIEKELGPSA